MLVLSRKKLEAVVIRTPDGTEITIYVVDVDRGKVRIGFDCDRSVTILRQELLEPKQE